MLILLITIVAPLTLYGRNESFKKVTMITIRPTVNSALRDLKASPSIDVQSLNQRDCTTN